MKPVLYLDMDQVLVNFNSSKEIPLNEKHIYNHPAIYKKGFFINLAPMEGAIDFVRKLVKEDFWDIYILTQPVAENPYSYGEKAAWVIKYLPELQYKINMTQEKSLFRGHVLVDDNKKWRGFHGKFMIFNPENPLIEFENVLYKLRIIKNEINSTLLRAS